MNGNAGARGGHAVNRDAAWLREGDAVNGTLPGLLARHAVSHPDGVALREKEFGIWQEVTWADYLGRVRAFSLGLSELGVERGDRLAIIGDNRPEWVIAELAAQSQPVILPIGLYQDSIAGELARMLEARRSARHRRRRPGAGGQGAGSAGPAARTRIHRLL